MELNEKDYAPVFIPTLCRYEHFKRCVDSLSRCTGAKYTTLFVGLDHPFKEEHWDGYNRIKEYIKNISGFKNVVVFERSENFGPLNNILESQKVIFKNNEAWIYSEDDNEFSPNFLEFVNKGLVKYREDSKVIAICGYSYPYEYKTNRTAFWGLGFSAWGVGEWRDKRLSIETSDVTNRIDETLNSWVKIWKLLRNAPKTINSMITMRTKGLVWGDVMLTVDCMLNNKGAIFPTLSKVRNWGNDGSGLHCKKREGSSLQVIDVCERFDDGFDVDFSQRERFMFRHRLSPFIKIIIVVRYLIFRLTKKDILACHYSNRK